MSGVGRVCLIRFNEAEYDPMFGDKEYHVSFSHHEGSCNSRRSIDPHANISRALRTDAPHTLRTYRKNGRSLHRIGFRNLHTLRE